MIDFSRIASAGQDALRQAQDLGRNILPPGGTAGQNPAAGGFPKLINQFASGVEGAAQGLAKGISQDVFKGVAGAANFMSAIRSKNIPGLAGGSSPTNTTASFSGGNVEEKDWRVSLSVPSQLPDYSQALSQMLAPLASTKNRMIFPYTPTILIQHSANYTNTAPLHNNYPYFAYQNSQVAEIVITGQFYCQNELDAAYWTACLHYLRSITKMDYGVFGTGQPPPIVKLNGYGDYVFNNVPVIITTFTVDMPNEVDYIATGIKGNTLSTASEYSWAPAESQFSVSCQPIYSREKQSQFSYRMFTSGYDIGRGYI